MLVLDNSTFTVLTTERLVLRKLSMDDLEAVFALRSDPVAMRYVPRPLAKDREEAAAHIQLILVTQQANEGLQWAITLKDNPSMVGIIGFWRMKKEHYRAEIGYMVLPKYWGQGIVSEAIAAVVQHAFDTLGFHSIEAVIDPQNPASMRVLEKNGFVREAWFKEDFFYNGEFLDSVHYGIVRPA